MPQFARVKSSKLPNEGWFETNKLLNLINETLLLMGISAKSGQNSTQHHRVDEWVDTSMAQVFARFNDEFMQNIGVLAKRIRSESDGWIEFCDQDWGALKKIIFPQAATLKVTFKDQQRITEQLNKFKDLAKTTTGRPQPNDIMAMGIAELFFNQQLQQFIQLQKEQAVKLDRMACLLLHKLSQVIALEATPLHILKLDEKHYSYCKRNPFTETAVKVASLVMNFSECSQQLACLKQGQNDIEKQALIVNHAASQLTSEFNIKTTEQTLKSVKHKLGAQRKALRQKTERIQSMKNQIAHHHSENELIKQQLNIEGELLEALRQEFVAKNDEILRLQGKIQQMRTEALAYKKETRRLQSALDKECTKNNGQKIVHFETQKTRARS